MNGFDLHKYMNSYRKLEKALSSTVRISYSEVCILIVKDLIEKRNNCSGEIQQSFDTVLKWYIDEEEFQRFVIEGKEVS